MLSIAAAPGLLDEHHIHPRIENFVRQVLLSPVGLTSSMAGVLAIVPQLKEQIAVAIKAGIASNERVHCRTAFEALGDWIIGCSIQRLPEVPLALAYELGFAVSSRRRPGLLDALRAMRSVVDRAPSAVDGSLLASALVGLRHLLPETDLKSKGALSILGEESLVIRRFAAALAGSIAKQGLDGGEIIKAWQSATENDAIVKIRRTSYTTRLS
jgi:hypothetical protein